MAEGNGNGTVREWYLKVFQIAGFPVIVACFLAYGFDATLKWEREQMMPTIRDNTHALKDAAEATRQVKECLDDWRKHAEWEKKQ